MRHGGRGAGDLDQVEVDVGLGEDVGAVRVVEAQPERGLRAGAEERGEAGDELRGRLVVLKLSARTDYLALKFCES